MKVLLTGGSGFLGAQLCVELLNAGHEITILDDNSRGKLERLAGLDGIQLINGDVCDYETVKAATKDCEVVWHLAYVNGTKYFYEKPDKVLEIGIKGTQNTVQAALECGVKRYVLASTSETYNEPTHIPTTESERLMIPDVTNPRFSYGGGKIACELIALHIGGFRGLETVIFRPHNFIGPNMGFEHVIPEITKRIITISKGLTKTEITLTIQGNGNETRAFCDIRDGARGVFIAGEKGKAGNIYNVGVEHEVSIRQLIESIANIMGIKVNIMAGELRAGSTSRRCPSIEKLQRLGYQPQHTFDQALEQCVNWYKAYYLKHLKYNSTT